jgi:hypothetical protein
MWWAMVGRPEANVTGGRDPRSRSRGRTVRALLLVLLLAFLLPTWSDGATPARPGAVLARVDVPSGLVQWAFPTADGGTLVAGTSPYGSFYLASLSETGAVVWQDDYDVEGYDVARVLDAAATPDGATSVLIEHSSAQTGKEGLTIVRYLPGGKRAWSHAFEESQTPSALEVDRLGNTYVAGESRATKGTTDAYVAKLTPEGDIAWQRTYNGPQGTYSDVAQDLTVDSAGNVYACGNTYGGKGRDSDALVLKYAKDGRLLWSRTYHRPRSRQNANKCDTARRVALDSRGDVVLGGWSHLSKADWDFLVVKYSPSGGFLWANSYSGPKANGRDLAQLLSTDGRGNVYLAGESEGSKAKDFAVVSFSRSGARRWVFRFDGPDHLEDLPSAMCVGPDGIVYVTGESWTIRRQSEFAIVAITQSGARRWVQRWNGGPYQDRPYALWFDRHGKLNVAGLTSSGDNPWEYRGVIVRLAP